MPDFENFRKAVLCEEEPARVPQFDGTVAAEHKARFLGRTVAGLADEIDFCMAAGYDFAPLTLGFRQTLRGEKSGIMGDDKLKTVNTLDPPPPPECPRPPFSHAVLLPAPQRQRCGLS